MKDIKLDDLAKELQQLGFGAEADTTRKLKIKMSPVDVAMALCGLNSQIMLEEDDGIEIDSPDENDNEKEV